MKVTATCVRIPGLQTERRKAVYTQAVSMFTAGLTFLFETTVKGMLYVDKAQPVPSTKMEFFSHSRREFRFLSEGLLSLSVSP